MAFLSAVEAEVKIPASLVFFWGELLSSRSVRGGATSLSRTDLGSGRFRSYFSDAWVLGAAQGRTGANRGKHAPVAVKVPGLLD
jgi:hypothetical protein